MINKFQQGGKLQDAIMLFVQGLAQVLQVKPEQVILVAQQNPKALESAVLVYQQTQDINQAAQAFTQSVQKAKQGAKLQYLKSLKHQCADDEELYYYKKGGKAGCGCRKKEDGEEVEKAQEGTVAKFKKDLLKKKVQPLKPVQKPQKSTTPVKKRTKAELAEIDRKSEEDYFKGVADHKVNGKKCGGEIEKKCGGSVIKAFKEKCGAKMKKHELGGSLSGIPFYLGGTNKGGISSSLLKRPISGAEAYMNDVAINDPLYKMYTNKANAYSNEAPTISNTFNNILNRLKASYYGNKAAIKGYADKVDKYSRYLWNRGNYGEAIFGSPFVPIVRDYQPNRPFANK